MRHPERKPRFLCACRRDRYHLRKRVDTRLLDVTAGNSRNGSSDSSDCDRLKLSVNIAA
jgi:hypothetical protein